MAKSTRGNEAQFTYDFGIAIAQSTVNKITKLTGVSLTLASAFYALKTNAQQYVDVLRENTLRFGGVLSTMKSMEQAQNRLIKGLSYFKVDDQLRGMNRLMAAGINAGENIEWINKAAHATGKSFSEFSNMIASAIQGNASALADAGLMTQRATRMFDKYQANTIMRQQAILKFVKNHKGLMNAIKNDFETIQDQTLRMKATWGAFLMSVMGNPKDPNSFYGQIVTSMKLVATALANNVEKMKRYGYIIGQTLGWVIRQIGHFVVWVGRQSKKTIESVWKVTDDYQTKTRSMLVWLEFWKLKVVDFFHKYGDEIMNVLKLLVLYKAMKNVFVISSAAIASVKTYRAAIAGTVLLQKRYIASMGPFIGKTTKYLQSLAVWLPRPFRRAWVYMGKFFADFRLHLRSAGLWIISAFKTPFKFIWKGIKFLFGLVRNLPVLIGASFKALRAMWAALNATNPVGWVILAITALTILYTKCKGFREFVDNLFKFIWESIKFIGNLVSGLLVYVQIGAKRAWKWFKEYIWNPVSDFFSSVGGWISNMWDKFKDSSVGKWLDDYIVSPLKKLFNWLGSIWNKLTSGLSYLTGKLSGTNTSMAESIEETAKRNGVYALPTFRGADYGNSSSSATPTNPILAAAPTAPISAGGETNTSSMNFSNGAIQIIIQKGEGIDENALARKVREVINDLSRGNNMRGGTA